jgi:hypothetical protein
MTDRIPSMQIVIHQFNRELLAQRTWLLVWAGVLLLQFICVGTGFSGEFVRTSTQHLTEILFDILSICLAIIPILIAASIAVADPARDEGAHWLTLPVRRRDLLLAKLLCVLVGIALPLVAVRTLTLLSGGAGMWFGASLMDFLSSYPGWMVTGFAVGAMAGSWKRFAVAMLSLLIGTVLLIFVCEILDDALNGSVFYRAGNTLEDCLETNLFLPGALLVIGLTYFTRMRSGYVVLGFVLVLPVTIWGIPKMTRSMVPSQRIVDRVGTTQIALQLKLPMRLLAHSEKETRLLAHVDYEDLSWTGIDAPTYFIPERLSSRLVEAGTDRQNAFRSDTVTYEFPGSYARWWNGEAPDFLERKVALRQAVPGLKLINPSFEAGEGFDLFEIDRPEMELHRDKAMNLQNEIRIEVGRYEKFGELPLEIGANTASDGTRLRIVAHLPQVSGRTQFMINESYARFTGEKEHHYNRDQSFSDPRRHPANLRYILVNADRGEACLPVHRSAFRMLRLNPLSMRSTIVDFSIAVDAEKDQAISEEWLAGAKLHVFRKVRHGSRQIPITTGGPIELSKLKIEPFPKHIEMKYR